MYILFIITNVAVFLQFKHVQFEQDFTLRKMKEYTK